MHLLEAKIFANALNQLPELGPVRLRQLVSHFGNYAKAWAADPSEYAQVGIPPKVVAQIIANKKKINPELSFAELARRQIEILLDVEPEFPQALKEIAAAPPLLYVRGQNPVLNSTCIAVVGTRKISSYGQQVCAELVAGLAQSNLTVVSGLAFGVDAAALNAAVSNEGSAVAVLASDLDNSSISPRVNFQLAQKILDRGSLISEYPLGMSVQVQNFPIRNRIISGLSLATIVVEADLESGALITANFALEQNREVFAVPGSMFSATSRGTNELIRRGAHIVTGVGSILDELNLDQKNLQEPISVEATKEEQIVLTKLSKEPTQVEDLIRALKLPAAQINAHLSILEMKGRVKNLGGAKYIKIR